MDSKVDKAIGKQLSTNDFTNELKSKLDTLQPITIDDDLDDTSTNPVQNKAIYSAFEEYDEIVGNKVDKVVGKQLSTNDFTDEYKNKLDNLTPGGYTEYEVTAVSDDFYLRQGNLNSDDIEMSAILLPDTTDADFVASSQLQLRVRTNGVDGRILMITGNLTKRPKYLITNIIKNLKYGTYTIWSQTQFSAASGTGSTTNGSVAGTGANFSDVRTTKIPSIECFLYDNTNRKMIPLLDGSKMYIKTK